MLRKKLIFFIGLLIILIFILNLTININHIKYKVDRVYVNEYKNEDNYYIELEYNSKKFSFSLYNKNIKGNKIINHIYTYKDKNYTCVFPLINNKSVIDMMCYNKDIYNYSILSGNNNSLDDYVKTIKEYNKNDFKDDKSKYLKLSDSKIYTSNKINKKISISTYKGIINDGVLINIFNKDIYDNRLSAYISDYYIIANYNSLYEFNEFILINLKNNEKIYIKSNYDISFDSYIQGIIGSKLYLFDRDNLCQYEIDVNKKTIKLIGTNTIKYYKQGKWQSINKNKIKDELLFDNIISVNIDGYYKSIKYNDYYYMFKRENDIYKLYRSHVNSSNVQYLFDLNTTDIKIYNNYIYYIYKNNLYYYSDDVGLRTVLSNDELMYNKTIKYYIY